MDENELVKELSGMMSSMKRRMFKNVMVCGVNHSEHKVLMSIAEQERGCEMGVKVSDLSFRHHISRPATSQLLNSMDKKGLIKRKTDDKDRRVTWILLTAEGRKMLADANETLMDYITKIVNKLGADDTRELIRLLSKLYMVIGEINEERTNE